MRVVVCLFLFLLHVAAIVVLAVRPLTVRGTTAARTTHTLRWNNEKNDEDECLWLASTKMGPTYAFVLPSLQPQQPPHDANGRLPYAQRPLLRVRGGSGVGVGATTATTKTWRILRQMTTRVKTMITLPWNAIGRYGQAFLDQQKENAEERKRVFQYLQQQQQYQQPLRRREREETGGNIIVSAYLHLWHTIQLTFATLAVTIILLLALTASVY